MIYFLILFIIFFIFRLLQARTNLPKKLNFFEYLRFSFFVCITTVGCYFLIVVYNYYFKPEGFLYYSKPILGFLSISSFLFLFPAFIIFKGKFAFVEKLRFFNQENDSFLEDYVLSFSGLFLFGILNFYLINGSFIAESEVSKLRCKNSKVIVLKDPFQKTINLNNFESSYIILFDKRNPYNRLKNICLSEETYP